MKIPIVLTEKQAKALLVYGRMLRDHGAGRGVSKDMRAIVRKIERAMKRFDGDSAFSSLDDIGEEK